MRTYTQNLGNKVGIACYLGKTVLYYYEEPNMDMLKSIGTLEQICFNSGQNIGINP